MWQSLVVPSAYQIQDGLEDYQCKRSSPFDMSSVLSKSMKSMVDKVSIWTVQFTMLDKKKKTSIEPDILLEN